MRYHVISFGYGHGPLTYTAHATFDVRQMFRDPHVSPEMREMTGFDQPVVTNVMSQPGAVDYSDIIAKLAIKMAQGRDLEDVVIAFGCVGGRHRSVVLANDVSRNINMLTGVWVQTTHRDIDKPVIRR